VGYYNDEAQFLQVMSEALALTERWRELAPGAADGEVAAPGETPESSRRTAT
jgi:hypothetical protein